MATLQASSIQGELTLSAGLTKGYGGSEWTTQGGQSGDIYVPYGGGYYTSVLYQNLGYTRNSMRIYYCLSISQQHGGLIDMAISRYGGGVTHTSYNSGYNTWSHQQFASNANYYQIRWQNTNSNSWGNGSVSCTIWYWGRDSLPTTAGAGSDDNFTSPQSGNFLRRSM